jgi:hypothetical protein
MTCIICKQGRPLLARHAWPSSAGATVLVVRGVPVQVCENCGEAYLSADLSGRASETSRLGAPGGLQHIQIAHAGSGP